MILSVNDPMAASGMARLNYELMWLILVLRATRASPSRLSIARMVRYRSNYLAEGVLFSPWRPHRLSLATHFPVSREIQ